MNYLVNLLKERPISAIFPVADACLKPIINNEEEISKYTTIALPHKETFMKGFDKELTLKYAINNDIPCPKTIFAKELDDVYSLKNNLEYPIIIKPRIGSGKRGVKLCETFEELVESYLTVSSKYGGVILQEFIPNGGELGVYTLFNYDSKIRALSVQRRLRSYPLSGGPSTLRETFRDDISEKATNYAIKLLSSMKWSGVAMVEFRIDARNGIPKLMEINPRFWGSLQLSVLSGVDFPYLLYKMIVDGDIEPILDYKSGVKCRWLLPGDILWFLSAPNKMKNLPEFLDLSIPDDIISLEDPGPSIGFSLATMRYLFNSEMWNFVLKR